MSAFWLSRQAFIPLIAANILSKSVNVGGELSRTRVVVVAADAGFPKSAGARKSGAVARKSPSVVVVMGVLRGEFSSLLWSSRGEGGVKRDGEIPGEF